MSLLSHDQQRFRITPFGCEFTVYGIPQQGGSKKGFVKKNKDTGKQRVVIVDDNKKDVRAWRNQIVIVASELMGDRPMFEGALMLVAEFYVPRPKSHFGVHGVRRSAPKYPTVRPDVSKYLRPLEDALSGLVWKDDSLIVEQVGRKRYGEPPRVDVKVALFL